MTRLRASHSCVRARPHNCPRPRCLSSKLAADGLVALLSAHVASYPVGPEGWLFAGPTGEPPHQNTVGHWWRKTLRDEGLSGFKLRHFFASGLIAEGCDVVTLQRALGHSKPTTRSTPTPPTCGRPPRTAPDALPKPHRLGDG